MPTRRSALKTLAGATVVGSLSGCVQLATQRTVEYHGTPAMFSTVVIPNDGLATGVGVEARRTIERVGVEKEIVTRNWGMVYPFWQDGAAVATFSTPSIQIAGQELNPIAELTVGDIGQEFASITFPFVQDGKTGDAEVMSIGENVDKKAPSGYVTKSVGDATGKKVLRAFREAVGSSGVQVDQRMDSPDYFKTSPNWDGEYHEFQSTYEWDGDYHEFESAMVFEKHDGDFVVLFGAVPKGGQLQSGQSLAETIDLPLTGDYDGSGGFVHPTEADFDREVLQRHLVETNVQGMQGMVKQARKIIDVTQELLEMGAYEKETLIQTVSDIQSTISDIQKTLQECDSDACETVLRHAEDRSAHARDAKQALQNNNPGNALQSLQQARAIVEDDIALLEDQDNNTAERALGLERTLLDDTQRASLSAAQWQTLLSTHEALNQVDQLLSKVEDELSSVLSGPGSGGPDVESLNRVREASKQSAQITKKAYERVASYNDTRNEEDDRFIAIEGNLRRIGDLSAATSSHMEKVSILYSK